MSQQALDQYQAAVTEAEARVEAQKKSLEIYRLNKEFTRIVSPIDGQVSRYYLTLGNLVNQDQTLLTTVLSLDPIYAYFDMDERTLLDIRKALAEGRIARHEDGEEVPVLMGLENEEGFPHRGTVNFVNNQVNSTTGSITFRGEFSNPRISAPPRPAAKSAAPAPRQLTAKAARTPRVAGELGGAAQTSRSRSGRGPSKARDRPASPSRQTPAACFSTVVAGDVRADPPADRPAAQGNAGDRSGHPVRPGPEVRLRIDAEKRSSIAASRPGRCKRTACASSTG